MTHLKCFVFLFLTVLGYSEASYQIGLGRFDVTGPSVEVPFMGYANMDQRGQGIHTRHFSRAFILQDTNGRRVVYASVEVGMISHAMRRDIVANLQQRYGSLYTINNVMLSATHTHSGPGGYHQYVLYDFTCLGFISETYNALVNGITQSIVNAHTSMFTGRIFVTETEVANAGVNRSPKAYLNNPQAERNRFREDVDRTMTQIRFVSSSNQVMGAFSWLAVHSTSMNNTNQLISSDNFGYASMQLEAEYNPNELVGQGSFIGAFCSAHSADISPNILGPRCQSTGLYCDGLTSTCPARDLCIAAGPGATHFESTRIIGSRIYDAASRLVRNGGGREITGSLSFIHQFVDMAAQTGTYLNPITNRVENYRGCLPAMGMSFGAGTTDGPGGFNFSQGSTSGNPFWDSVRDFIAEPTPDDIACHDPKPILLNTGRTSRPYQWQPAVVPTQMFRIGDLVILGLPGEFTTMAGRRLRTEIQNRFGQNLQIILSGITNIYSSYIVTPEEYQVQRYEGASTIYGPHTLTIYISQFTRLFTALNSNQALPPGPTIPDERSSQMTFLTPVINDSADGSSFGAVLVEPRKNYRRGETVFASFISGNPRNNLMTQSTFFSVEQLQGSGAWRVIATDANWETRFVWRRTSALLGRSEIDFIWEIPANVGNGEYRVRHNGSSRGPVTGIRAYVGITHQFAIA